MSSVWGALLVHPGKLSTKPEKNPSPGVGLNDCESPLQAAESPRISGFPRRQHGIDNSTSKAGSSACRRPISAGPFSLAGSRGIAESCRFCANACKWLVSRLAAFKNRDRRSGCVGSGRRDARRQVASKVRLKRVRRRLRCSKVVRSVTTAESTAGSLLRGAVGNRWR